MGGEISVGSSIRQGSTFTVRLPFKPKPAGIGDTSATTSEITGLSCLVAGDVKGLAPDLGIYLNTRTQSWSASTIFPPSRSGSATAPGLWVVVIDAEDTAPQLDDLNAAGRERPDLDLRFVVIGRGKRRWPRLRENGVVTVDGNLSAPSRFDQGGGSLRPTGHEMKPNNRFPRTRRLSIFHRASRPGNDLR